MPPTPVFLLAAHPIVHVNASLNAAATVLLVIGLYLIKQGRVEAHKRTMLTAFCVSAVFLACYLYYHYQVGSVRFTHSGAVRYAYYAILASHVLLAFTVPFLAIWTIYLGLRATGCCSTAPPVSEHFVDAAACRERHMRLGPLDVSNLAVCFGDRRRRLCDALPPLAASWALS